MATTTWDAWDDDVLPDVPGVTAPFARHQVKLAAIEFCKRAWVWLVDQGPISIAATQNDYDWEAPTGTDVARALQVWLEKRRLLPKTRNELSAIFGDYMRAEGPAQYFVADVPTKLIIVPRPNNTSFYGVTAKVAIAPKRSATGMDSTVYDRYFDDIAKGAKARLLVMARKPWTDAARGLDLRQEFEDAMASAKTDVIRSYAGARLRNRAQFF